MFGAGGTWHRVVLYLRDSIPVTKIMDYGIQCYDHLLVATRSFEGSQSYVCAFVVQPPLSCGPTLLYRPFVKDFEGLVKWTSNFWNQLVHREIYPSTIMKE